MKKITLLALLAASTAFAQQPQSYLDATSQAPSSTDGLAIITSQNLNPVVETYTSFGDFDAALTALCVDDTVTDEDFSGGPGGITACGPVVSSAGDGCFTAGELEAGFTVEASNGTDVVFIPPGAIGNVDALIGASAFAEYTIINFDPNVYAVAMDLWENNEPITQVRIFDAGGTMIELLDVNTPTNAQTFFGFIADEPISKVELEGDLGSGELFGLFIFGADCSNIVGIDDNALTQISLFPNPASDKVNIQLPAGVEIESVVVYDVLGKGTATRVIDNQINVSQLAEGVYLVTINTSLGTITKQIVKK